MRDTSMINRSAAAIGKVWTAEDHAALVAHIAAVDNSWRALSKLPLPGAPPDYTALLTRIAVALEKVEHRSR
jgi:hypothetical protein